MVKGPVDIRLRPALVWPERGENCCSAESCARNMQRLYRQYPWRLVPKICALLEKIWRCQKLAVPIQTVLRASCLSNCALISEI